jgi:tRNA U38,U39,U40 pseudouridine synthase TruA
MQQQGLTITLSSFFIFPQVMETAGKKLIGEHDFRNFCKMDAVKVHNYRRNVMSFEISPCDMRSEFINHLV